MDSPGSSWRLDTSVDVTSHFTISELFLIRLLPQPSAIILLSLNCTISSSIHYILTCTNLPLSSPPMISVRILSFEKILFLSFLIKSLSSFTSDSSVAHSFTFDSSFAHSLSLHMGR